MGRPPKDAARADTRLIALRLPRELLAGVDAHARRMGSTRSAAFRDLLARGLSDAGSAIDRSSLPAPCAWCEAPAGSAHLPECPHHPDSALGAFIRGTRSRRRPRS